MKWTLLCCALLCSTLLLAQQKFTISGYVEDAETGEKLIGANVVDVRLKKGTTANEYGFFSLTLPADSVQLAVSFVGYDTYRTALLLNKDMQLNVSLREGNVLKEVEVKATQAGEAIQERTQMSSVSIPIKQIQSLPAFMGEVDVIKVLQLMPGVQSGTEGSSGLFVRGGSPDQNLILLDGVPVYNVSHLFGFFSVFDANAINSVELIKGGYPARYGGRLSSVLDIRLKEGNMKQFSGNASIGLISSKLSLEAPIVKDKCSFIVSGRRTYIDLLARPLIMAETNGDSYGGYYFHDFSAKLNYKFSDKDRLYVSGYT
ncbi:MAG TPA: TonB-dependent receptor, partial [Chitinophagales bacterium]|nr:TonB-dependent receptor [Chitinophagales bacterium]